MDNEGTITSEGVELIAKHLAMTDQEIELTRLRVRLTTADALYAASQDAAKFVAKYVADTESVIGQRALDRLEKAIRECEETQNGS